MNSRPLAAMFLFLAPSLITALLAPATAIAQPTSEILLPAQKTLRPELEKFEPLLGHWKGEGTAMVPGAGEMKWTSHSTIKPVLDGKFIQGEMTIRFDLGTLFYRSYYGWDPSQEKLVSYSIGNTGEFEISDHVAWAPDGKLLICSTKIEEGVPLVTRNVITIEGDKQSFRWEAARGAGNFELVVSGSSERTTEEFKITPSQWSAPYMPGMPVAPEMQKLFGMAGEYRVKGRVSMSPEMSPMTVTARESVRKIYGGIGIMIEVLGDPVPAAGNFRHEAIAFIVWDPTRKCFKEFWISNGGETSVQELRFVEDRKLVTVSMGMQMGAPQAVRGTIELDENGALSWSTVDRFHGSHASDQYFVGTYEKLPE